MNDRRRRDEEFVNSVLNRTSGSPCHRALDQLPALADNHLQGLDRQLVQAHLEHCDSCRAVAVTLGWLGTLLPEMAVVEPGPAFTAAVTARTSRALTPTEKSARAGVATGPAALVDRVGRWWQKQILKPQFAMQFAYVATVILVLLTALPISPFRGTPEKALQVVQAGPQGVPLVGVAVSWVDDRSTAMFTWAQGGLGNQWRNLEGELDSRRQRSRDSWDQLETHLEDAASRAQSAEIGQAGYELLQAARSGRNAWINWWHQPTVTAEQR